MSKRPNVRPLRLASPLLTSALAMSGCVDSDRIDGGVPGIDVACPPVDLDGGTLSADGGVLFDGGALASTRCLEDEPGESS